MLKDTIKPRESAVFRLMREEMGATPESEIVTNYINGVAKNLTKNPTHYRSYGPYWWALKEIMINHGINKFGETLEVITTEHFKYDDEAYTVVAAWDYSTMKFDEGRINISNHNLPTEDGEGYEYELIDQEMEFYIADSK